MTVLRSLAAALAAFVLAYLTPAGAPLSVLSRLDLPAVVIFVALFGMLAFTAVDRRQRLKEAIALELNKIRRVYHLGKNLGAAPHLRGWFTDLHGYIYDYLGTFEKFDLRDYDKGNALFRKIAYHLYTVPELKEVKEQVLYDELLDASAIVSDARQRVMALHRSRFTHHHWFELLLAILLFVAAVLAGTTTAPYSRLISALTLGSGFLLALTFFTHDIWTEEGDKLLAKEYVKNIARLELRREV